MNENRNRERPSATAMVEKTATAAATPETAATEPEAVDLRAYRRDRSRYIHLGTGATPGNFAAIFAPSRLF